MKLRVNVLVIALGAVAACDPLSVAHTAAVQQPVPQSAGEVPAMIGRIAERHGLQPSRDSPEGWAPCYALARLSVCSRLRADTIEVRYVQRPVLMVKTDPLRHEIADSLRALLGPDRVRECGWQRRDWSCEVGAAPTGLGIPIPAGLRARS